MKKTKTTDLKSLWKRAGKSRKITSTSTPKPPSAILPPAEAPVQCNSSPNELQLQVYNHTNIDERGDGEVPILTKGELGALRDDDGWKTFLEEVTTFCVKHDITVPSMDDQYEPVIKSKRYKRNINNLHRFRVEIFLSVIDRQLRELNDRFDEVNTELLICMGSFNPSDSFAAYDKDHLLKLAQFYPMDFSSTDLVSLKYQLAIFINDMRRDKRFRKVNDLGELSVMLVKTDKICLYPLVYKLLKLVLVLPVATASVERVFPAMNYVKNDLRNKIGEEMLNDCMVTCIEWEFFKQVKDEAVISRFQSMKERIVKLY